MSKILTCLLAASCTAAAGLSSAGEAGKCDCVSWADAYAHRGANCANLKDPYVCAAFLMKLPSESFCMNAKFGSGSQWCYVASDCKEGKNLTWLDDGEKSDLLWKECGAHSPRLGDKKVDQLTAWCDKHDLDVGVAAQFAYAVAQENLYEVMPYWDLKLPKDAETNITVVAKDKMQPFLARQLAKQAQAHATFYKSGTDHSPFGIAEGGRFYFLNVRKELEEMLVGGRESELWDHPHVMTAAKCVAGCKRNEEVWWSPLNNK
mmetsp:Transcript_80825/g.228949  ORF Transcript_80825/g.228949 Transcript_80825/m.228949 type:complete len:262 (+) Transcript_80825:49-834(+)